MSQLSDLRLFTTHPHPCSYLEGEMARTLFIDPEASITKSQHSRLSEIGFRRSGSHYYRPFCEQCQACIPCRVSVDDFKKNRRFRRVLARNSDVDIRPVDDIATAECYGLYQRYINERHDDGDMYPANREQYTSFLLDNCETTRYCEMRVEGRLVGIFVCDELDDGLSAVYTFFDPDEMNRSLGSLAILWQLDKAQELALPYLYLGYWIKDCRKMQYKADYQPLELFINGGWKLQNEQTP